MKMAKASEADLRMAMDLANALESFERGFFLPEREDEDSELFDRTSGHDCRIAMEKLLAIVRRGSIGRVVFGMIVLMDPKNEAVDPSVDYLEKHPKVRMHDELVAALHAALAYNDLAGFPDGWDADRMAAVLAKVDGLRPYQREALARADGIATIPTGAGKTVIGGALP